MDLTHVCLVLALVAGAALCWIGWKLTTASNWGARVAGAALFLYGVLLIVVSLKDLIK